MSDAIENEMHQVRSGQVTCRDRHCFHSPCAVIIIVILSPVNKRKKIIGGSSTVGPSFKLSACLDHLTTIRRTTREAQLGELKPMTRPWTTHL
jgi:hypothetical protein